MKSVAKILVLLFLAVFAGALSTQGTGAKTAAPDLKIGSFGFPPPPPLKAAEPAAQRPETASAAMKMTAMAPPPPRARCITPEERNAALSGTGCSCTCREYAAKPVSDRCDIACGGHYMCWSPIPTDQEIEADYNSKISDPNLIAAFPTYSALSDEQKANARGFLRLQRGLEWDQARQCEAE